MDSKKLASILAGLIIGYLAWIGFSLVAQEMAIAIALEERRRFRLYAGELVEEWKQAKGYYKTDQQ